MYNFSALDAILKKNTSELPDHLQGVSFSVFDNTGSILYSKAFGTRTLDPTSEPLTTETRIWTSSLSKLPTTMACMIAVEQGLLTLDGDVRGVVPELRDVKLLVGFEEGEKPRKPILEDVEETITLRQLLSHTSGFTYDVFDAGLMEWSRYNKRTAHSHCGSFEGYTHPLIHKPGQSWAYGPGMDWAGRAVELTSGLTLEAFLNKYLFAPLAITSTTFHPTPSYLAHKQTHATRSPNGALLPGGAHHVLALPARDCIGGMGLYSTVPDLLALLKLVLINDGSVLAQDSVREILTGQLAGDTQEAFMRVIGGKARTHLRQTWPEGAEGTFGLSASINEGDFPGRRRAGSWNWAGSSGLHAWIDAETGIGGLMTTQLAPPGDPMFTKCFVDCEEAVYAALRGV